MSGSDPSVATARQRRGLTVRVVAGVAAISLWIVAPIAAVAVLTAVAMRVDAIGTEDVWAPPQASGGVRERSAGLQVQWNTAADLVAPEWSGLVQEVFVEAGDEIRSGQPVVRIDGVRRIALASDLPFSRMLSVGDRGVEAAALNSALAGLGLEASDSDTVTWATLRGVRALAAMLEVPSAGEVAAFDPSWIIFLPDDATSVEKVALSVGSRAPSAGEVIVTAPLTIAAAYLVSADEIPSPQELQSEDPPRTLDPIVADAGESLTVGMTPLELDESRSRIASDSLPALRNLATAGAPFLRGVLVSDIAADALRVPVSAIVSDTAGVTCVIVGTEFSGTSPAHITHIPVDVIASDAGVAWVVGDVASDSRVLATPAGESRSCRA